MNSTEAMARAIEPYTVMRWIRCDIGIYLLNNTWYVAWVTDTGVAECIYFIPGRMHDTDGVRT